jgi:hypothetical protein
MNPLPYSSGLPRRRGVVLLVVLAMLALFALVAVTFVYMSSSAVVSMNLNKLAQVQSRPEPDLLFSYALTQLVYENENPQSALWTHSLVRNLFGSGNQAFSGVGRVRDPMDGFLGGPPFAPFFRSEYLNMQGRPIGSASGPGIVGVKAGNRTFFNEDYYGSLTSPYTYPDHNHAFLGAFTPEGVVYQRSFVRSPSAGTNPYSPGAALYTAWWLDLDPWMFSGTGSGLIEQAIASGNAPTMEWTNLYQELARRRALVLRPRPSIPPTHPVFTSYPYQQYLTNLAAVAAGGSLDGLFHPYFPAPDDLGGDAKNLPNTFRTQVNPTASDLAQGFGPQSARNDSYWIDLGFPVQTDPTTGRRYKPLFAFFITDLDGCINLNFAGNSISGGVSIGQQMHASNQGWGPWEINPSRVLDPSFLPGPYAAEYPILFGQKLTTGNAGAQVAYSQGKWGLNGVAGNGTSVPGFNSVPHFYGQVNYTARDALGNVQGAPTMLQTAPATSPLFPPNYLNGYPNDLLGHYSQHQLPALVGDDVYFAPENMEAFLRHGDSGSFGLYSDIRRLMPISYAAPNPATSRFARLMTTTHSFDTLRAGLAPYLIGPQNPPFPPPPEVTNGYPANAWATGSTRRVGQQAFGTEAVGGFLPFGTTPGGEYRQGYKSANAGWQDLTQTQPLQSVLQKVNLNRYLRPYPHQGTFNNPAGVPEVMVDDYTRNNYIPPDPVTGALTPPVDSINGTPSGANQVMPAQPTPVTSPLDLSTQPALNQPVRFDRHPAYVAAQAAAAHDRQMLAMDIYRRLVAVTGVTVPPLPPTGSADPAFNSDLRPLRMLAQLAVNIVDFIDEDDICTPFNFYTAFDAGLAGGAGYQSFDIVSDGSSDPDRQMRRYWVYGTEMPRLVLNEVLAEYTLPAAPGPGVNFNVKLWAELASTLPAAFPPNNPNRVDLRAEPLWVQPVPGGGGALGYAPYQVVIAATNHDATDYYRDPLWIPPQILGQQDNVNSLGIWHVDTAGATTARAKTQPTDFQNPVPLVPQSPAPSAPNDVVNPIRVPPGGAVIIGAPAATAGEPPDAHRSINGLPPNGQNGPSDADGRVPINTPLISTPNMQYQVDYQQPNRWMIPGTNVNIMQTDANPGIGVTVLLRRLANPYLPYDANPASPAYNPYVTVDYLDHIPLNNTTTALYRSRGKLQLMASARGHVQPQQPNPDPNPSQAQVIHTLGYSNRADGFPADPDPRPVAYDWLVHLDRRLVSPMELLNVSGYKPHELTRKFVSDVAIGDPTNPQRITGDPGASQWVPIHQADATVPMPAIRPGMIVHVGGNTPSTADDEYVTVLGVDLTPTPPNPPRIYGVFKLDHDINDTIGVPHNQRALWLDESRRLNRAFEFLDAVNRFQSRVSFNVLPDANPVNPPSPFPGLTFQRFFIGNQEKSNFNQDVLALSLVAGAFIEFRNPATGLLLAGQVADVSTLPTGSFIALVPTAGLAGLGAPSELYVHPHAGRVPGKINLNAIRGPEVFRALCDAQMANSFNPQIGVTPALARGSQTVTLPLPAIDPSNPNTPMGITNGVPWVIQPGSYLEFRHPINGPETVQVTQVAGNAGNFTLTFAPPLQAGINTAKQLDYQPGAAITVDNVTSIFDQLVLSRDGNPLINFVGRPFQGFTRGASGPTDQYPAGAGIVDSPFRPEPTGNPNRTLFEVFAANPAKSYELLTKIAGNTTSRSNVFAVWMTVGFFEVQDATFGTVVLRDSIGPEMGRMNGRNVRHRMFAIIDRSVIDRWVQTQGPNYSVALGFNNFNYILGNGALDPRHDRLLIDVVGTVGPPQADGSQIITLPFAATGVGPGQQITVDEGLSSQEVVTINAVLNNQILVRFDPNIMALAQRQANPVRLTNRLPRCVIHSSIIE